jgi:hypothetical protein
MSSTRVGGAWLEVTTDDPSAVQQKVLDAGLPQLRHPGNDFFYFQAPGGQVIRSAPTKQR